MRIKHNKSTAVIGAGWLGCHLAVTLMKEGYSVKVFEAGEKIFAGASGGNQCRLHLGFHYPRSAATRRDVIGSFNRMRAAYGHFVEPIARNIYAVADSDSILDFGTFTAIMASEQVNFWPINPEEAGLTHVEGALLCEEMALNHYAATAYFAEILKPAIHCNSPVTSLKVLPSGVQLNGETFDYCIDCTANGLRPRTGDFFEPCIMFAFERRLRDRMALTIMDGPFGSIYPYPSLTGGENLHLLSSVTETPREKVPTYGEAQRYLESISSSEAAAMLPPFLEMIHHYYPTFSSEFSLTGHVSSVKSKSESSTQERECRILREGDLFRCSIGKVSQIFQIEDALRKELILSGITDSSLQSHELHH